ncbi:MAG: AMP-binding protein [Pseudomonadales bacterium]|nr:AMP-binding protein [Pseudomonadales bacterium]NRA16559.1 AMP-binding protein [Oceanospirillaceae bacterium]
MSQFFSSKENQNSSDREKNLCSRLADFIQYAKTQCDYYAQTLADIEASEINSRQMLATLPVTRKSALIKLQAERAPLAGMTAASAVIGRLFQSPGPINEPESTTEDWWRMGSAFYAAGFRSKDKVQNCLSYHLTPGGFILDSGARACGCVVIAAGPGQSEQQLDVIESLRPEGYCGTPSFLKILLEKAATNNRDISSIRKALVTGEAYMPQLREQFKQAGITALQAYATADVGLIAYESDPHQGLIIAEDILVEIVRPGTNQLVAAGEVGEVVVTSFNRDYPLIRFATGDLSAELEGTSACGRTNMRIKGWMGRADQTTKVKGMFVHPEQVEKVRLQHGAINKVRLVVSQHQFQDQMLLLCEVDSAVLAEEGAADTAEQLTALIAISLKNITKLNGKVQLVATDSLQDDGKVIDDIRELA